MPHRPDRRPRGFTLLELLIAVGMLAVLASLALPAYREQVARARRTEMQTALLEDAGYMQRYYAANNAYDGVPPPRLTVPTSPRGGTASYVITVVATTDESPSFLLTATRTGAMSADPCGDFTYDHLGLRGLVGGTFASGRSAAACWR